MKMSPFLAIIALVNGMIGGLMLILPILVLRTGTLLSFIIIMITGFLSFYSCFLYTSHQGDYTDVDKAIYCHFWNSKGIKVFYDFVVFLNLLLILISYFLLIVQQWDGLLTTSILNPIFNAVGLFGLILFLKYIRFGAHLLGYGVISIILYCVFLAWMVGSAPSGPNTIPIVGTGIADLAGSMAQAFSIQQFFIPVLKQLPAKENKNYTKYIIIVYIIGGLAYIFIAFAGSFGILNRPVMRTPATTIQDYFKKGQWQVDIIESIYLLHLYSAFGQYILITKKRFFGMLKALFDIKNSRQGEFFTLYEAIFVIVVIGIGLGLSFAKVSFVDVIVINGAVIGFFFIYLFPALMQFKCLYLTKKGKKILQVVFSAFSKNKNQDLQMSVRSNSGGIRCSAIDRQTDSISVQGSQTPYTIDQSKKRPKVKQSTLTQQNKDIIQQLKKDRQVSQIQDKIQDNQVKGADLSMDLSQIDGKSTYIIQRISIVCQCEKYQGIKKAADIIIIFFMMGLGLYVLIYGIISVS